MSKNYKGATPTCIFTFADFDPTTAAKIICTFSNGLELTEEDMEVTSGSISIWLSQAQTLAMPEGKVGVQFNFLFADGQRSVSAKKAISWEDNLHDEVMR